MVLYMNTKQKEKYRIEKMLQWGKILANLPPKKEVCRARKKHNRLKRQYGSLANMNEQQLKRLKFQQTLSRAMLQYMNEYVDLTITSQEIKND